MDFSKQVNIDKTLSIKDRIAFLKYCSDLYNTDGSSKISDKDYDIEYTELENLEPDNPFFLEVGGISDNIQGQAVPHKHIMGSLNKSPDIDSFLEWLKTQYSHSQIITLSFILQHKVDGLSLGLKYRDGKLYQAVTRGDGTTGIDVTEKAKMVDGVRLTIPCKDELEVRGECYKKRKDFYAKWHKSVGGNYMNPRNFTAGAINEKDPQQTKERDLSFVGYEVVGYEFNTEKEKNDFVESQGFNTLNSTTKKIKVGCTYDLIAKAVKYYMDSIDRANLEYDIDGIVFKLNDIKLSKKMGAVAGGRKSKANRAVKFPPEEKETIFIDFVAQVGRTGRVTPVAILEPVELGGAMISKATLHNFGELIKQNSIKIGATVAIQKKGDIIPQIVTIKKNGTVDIKIPSNCPSCNEDLEWTENKDGIKVDLVCNNIDCPAQLNKKIVFWFKTLGVKGFSDKTVARLTDDLTWDNAPIISSLIEMYYMLDNDRKTDHPFRKYAFLKEQMGEKTYENLIESIHSIKEVTLPIFVEALGFKRIGSMAKDICDIFPTIDDLDKVTINDLMKIDKFGPEKAKNFVNAWEARREEIRRLLKYITIKQEIKASNKLEGKKFCFTGSFSQGRNELEQIVIDNGGKASSSVGKDVILVWDGSDEAKKGKYEKAISNGNKIISEEDFFNMIKA
jgi:DNA ligase (NAD+)